MKLSPHFSLAELTTSQTAIRHGLNNEPGTTELANLRQLCQKVLEPVRKRLNNNPIFISSGYRSKHLNRMIGGSLKSAHQDGRAADFTAPSFGDPEEIAYLLASSDIEFDQLILEFGRWIHISYSEAPRRQMMTAQYTSNGTVYLPGVVT